MEFQTRTKNGEMSTHETMEDALDYAQSLVETDDRVWKISFSLPTKERIRLVMSEHGWILEDVYGYGHKRGI